MIVIELKRVSKLLSTCLVVKYYYDKWLGKGYLEKNCAKLIIEVLNLLDFKCQSAEISRKTEAYKINIKKFQYKNKFD